MKSTVIDIRTGDEIEVAASTEPMPEVGPAQVPAVVSRFQARAALLEAGLLASAEVAIADASALAQMAWAEATEWRRDSPTIAAIAEALELTPAQVDDLFRAAALITA